MKHTVTIRLLLIIIIANLAVAGAYIYGYLLLQEGQARITALEKEITVEEKKVAELDDVSKTLEEFKSYQDAVNSHLVAPDGIVEFVEYIEKIAALTGVKLEVSDLKTEDVQPKALPRLEYLRTTFSAKGSWEQVLRFALLIETAPYQVYVSGMSLETDGTVAKGEKVLWRIGVNASVPKLKK